MRSVNLASVLRLRIPLPILMLSIVSIVSIQLFVPKPAALSANGHSGHSHPGRTVGERIGTPDGAVEGHATDFYLFKSLPEMVATSDLVVEGTVTSVATPPPYQEIAGELEGEVGFSEASLRIDAVHYVRGGADELVEGDSIIFRQIVSASGKSVVINNVQHAKEGDRGFYFLTLLTSDLTDSGPTLVYNLISSQGRYLVQSDNTLSGSNPEDALVQTLQSLTPQELTTRIDQAEAAILRGEVQPLQPLIPCPDGGCGLTDAPDIEVDVDAEGTRVAAGFGEGQWISWQCEALAVNALAKYVEITECTLREIPDTWVESAPAVKRDGNIATTSDELFSARNDRVDVEICWKATTTFENVEDGVAADEGCEILQS